VYTCELITDDNVPQTETGCYTLNKYDGAKSGYDSFYVALLWWLFQSSGLKALEYAIAVPHTLRFTCEQKQSDTFALKSAASTPFPLGLPSITRILTGSSTAQWFLWPPCVADADIIFLPCGFFLLSFFYSSPNRSGWRLDVYHTSAHGVALVQI